MDGLSKGLNRLKVSRERIEKPSVDIRATVTFSLLNVHNRSRTVKSVKLMFAYLSFYDFKNLFFNPPVK